MPAGNETSTLRDFSTWPWPWQVPQGDFAVTLRTALREHHEAARCGDLPCAVAGGACLALGAGLRSGALASFAWGRSAQADLALATGERLFQREALLHAHIRATRRPVSSLATATPAATAEELRKNVLKVAEDVGAHLRAALDAGVTEAIVATALVFIGEDLKRLCRLFEARFGGTVAGVAVGVVLQRGLTIRLANLVTGGGLTDPQDLVEVALVTHKDTGSDDTVSENKAPMRSRRT
jgi:hypothetical protein